MKGNERISADTIIMFADVDLNQNIDDVKLNEIIKNLYDTNFFKNVSVEIKSNILRLNVIELPIIEKVNIKENIWELKDVTILKNTGGILKDRKVDNYKISSIYNFEKINSLFKNFDTMSFLDLLTNYKTLIKSGYNKSFLNQSLHTMLSLPFFLLMMTAIAAILTMNTLKRSDNFKFIILGLIITVLVFYFKDLSLALGQTNRIPLILAVWAPVIALSLFTFIGVLQINEK